MLLISAALFLFLDRTYLTQEIPATQKVQQFLTGSSRSVQK